MASRTSSAGSPIIIIRPRRGFAAVDLPELWEYRELLRFFVWRDLKVRYKQTVFGAAWAVIQPLMLMVVLTLFLGRVPGIASTTVPYPVFAFAALVPWTLFAQSLIGSSNSLVNAANLVEKVYFPRLLLPVAAVGVYLLDFGIALVVLFLIMLAAGVVPTLTALWIVPFTVLAVVCSLGIGIWLAAVNVRFRDVRLAIPLLIQIGLFASPVAYTADLVPPEWRTIYYLNPMASVIDGFRWALLGGSLPPFASLAISVFVAAAILITGLFYFRRVERTFADVI